MNTQGTPSPGSTAIHRKVEACRAGQCPTLVRRVRSGWVVMGDEQIRCGYCLLLPDPVVAHLNELRGDLRTQFLTDMARLGDALLAGTGALRINYALYGNLEPALHAHVFPRYADEPENERSAQPWALDWTRAPPYSEQAHGKLRAWLRAALAEPPRVPGDR
jgi:diadenosine tetraphosphate (Ap4A) HIT family hydrolase